MSTGCVHLDVLQELQTETSYLLCPGEHHALTTRCLGVIPNPACFTLLTFCQSSGPIDFSSLAPLVSDPLLSFPSATAWIKASMPRALFSGSCLLVKTPDFVPCSWLRNTRDLGKTRRNHLLTSPEKEVSGPLNPKGPLNIQHLLCFPWVRSVLMGQGFSLWVLKSKFTRVLVRGTPGREAGGKFCLPGIREVTHWGWFMPFNRFFFFFNPTNILYPWVKENLLSLCEKNKEAQNWAFGAQWSELILRLPSSSP